MGDYRQEAQEDANEFVLNFKNKVVSQIIGGDDASDDFFNDYAGGDVYHHETHVDK